jgi:hypothetical protein
LIIFSTVPGFVVFAVDTGPPIFLSKGQRVSPGLGSHITYRGPLLLPRLRKGKTEAS